MKKKCRRVSTRVHTRKIDRCVARKRAQQAGMRKVTKNGFFANNWQALAKEGAV